MASSADIPQPGTLPPPITERGIVGWAHANLFSTWYNTVLTFVFAAILVLTLWFGLGWILLEADWKVVATLGGRSMIGQYNTEFACAGQNCFWRPQVSLLMVSALLGMAWAVSRDKVAGRIAIGAAVLSAAFALLPYSMEQVGLDARLLLVANLPAVAAGWALARYTPLGSVRWIVILGVLAFLVTLVLLRGLPGVPGLQPVSVIYWGGLMLNLLLAATGIALSLPIGIALALGRRSRLPVVKLLCVVFIEVFRGVPLITLLFMSQVLVPLAFPEEFPANSLFRAGGGDYPLQFRLHGREYPGRLAGPSPRPGGGGKSVGTARLADHHAHLPAPGHPQRHPGYRGTVHCPVQGYDTGVHYRDAGRVGVWPGVHSKETRNT